MSEAVLPIDKTGLVEHMTVDSGKLEQKLHEHPFRFVILPVREILLSGATCPTKRLVKESLVIFSLSIF